MARFYIRENSKASCNSCGSTLIFELKDSIEAVAKYNSISISLD